MENVLTMPPLRGVEYFLSHPMWMFQTTYHVTHARRQRAVITQEVIPGPKALSYSYDSPIRDTATVRKWSKNISHALNYLTLLYIKFRLNLHNYGL